MTPDLFNRFTKMGSKLFIIDMDAMICEFNKEAEEQSKKFMERKILLHKIYVELSKIL